jgi:hypothetical protein
MNDNIDELKARSDQAEEEYQRTLQARQAAVVASQAAAKTAARARSLYLRALGKVQVEEDADVGA